MALHKFKPGQVVRYYSPRSLAGASRYTIIKLLPIEAGLVSYRIKSADENFERVAKEGELTHWSLSE